MTYYICQGCVESCWWENEDDKKPQHCPYDGKKVGWTELDENDEGEEE